MNDTLTISLDILRPLADAVLSSWGEQCPECGDDVFTWEGQDEDGTPTVSDGEYALCLGCGAVSAWTADGESESEPYLTAWTVLYPEALAVARATLEGR